MACKKCNKHVNGSDQIVCRGFCGAVFHVICANVDLPLLDLLGEYERNVFWMCNGCADLFSNEHFKSIAQRNSNNAVASDTDMKAMKVHIEKLSCAINSLSAKVDSKLKVPVAGSPMPWGTPKDLVPNTPKRRRGNSGNSVEPLKNASGTRGTKPSVGSVNAVSLSDDLFWIYLSAFHPKTSEDEIAALVQDCLGLNADTKPKVVKLVPRGTDLSTWRFVSFKVGVRRDLKTVALSSDSWPDNVLFREFEDNQAKNVVVGLQLSSQTAVQHGPLDANRPGHQKPPEEH